MSRRSELDMQGSEYKGAANRDHLALVRLALSHNKIATFPARFSECTLLRYLNVRNNRITEFPLPVSHLPCRRLCRFVGC